MARLIPTAYSRWGVVLLVVLGASLLWPFYRKFVIDQWHQRVLAQEPVIFTVDCPSISDHFKCNDRYTITTRKAQSGEWCLSVRKNQDAESAPVCGINPDARDFSRYWHSFDIDGQRLYYSWRGRILIRDVGYVGWLATPEDIAARAHRPISVD